MVCVQCGNKFPTLIKVEGKERNLCNRKRCLDCSPFREKGVIEYLTPRVFYETCNLCGKKNGLRLCRSCRTRIKRYRDKEKAIQIMGGKCIDCGFTGDHAVFDFHHLDGNTKEFTLGNIANRRWELIEKELKKCVLLCANCHRIRHSKRGDSKLHEEAKRHFGSSVEHRSEEAGDSVQL